MTATRLPTLADIQAERDRRALARESFETFIRATFPTYRPKAFHLHVARRLQAWANFESRHLIIIQPPRSGKSEHATRRLPAWLFGRMPSETILMTAHTQPIANRFSDDIRRIIRQPAYRAIFPDTRLADSGRADARSLKTDWEIVGHLGRLRAAGVGVGIVGDGYRRAIIDDVFRNMEEAHSPTARERAWRWYMNDVRTRLEYPYSELLVNTRWHKDDVIGRLIEHEGTTDEGGKWEVIRLPFVQDRPPNDYDSRELGEYLWPEWFQAPWEHLPGEQPPDVQYMPEVDAPVAILPDVLQQRAAKYYAEYKGDRDAALQGDPVPEGGNILRRDWLRSHWQRLPAGDVEYTIFCDPKGGSKDPASSRVVIQLWCRALESADVYLVAQARGLWDLPETIEALRALTTVAPWSWARAKIVEDKADGKGIVATLRSALPGMMEYKLPGLSKAVRYRGVAPYWQAGNVHLPPVELCIDPLTGENWLSDFVAEHAEAPSGTHDDQIDTSTMAVSYYLHHEHETQSVWADWDKQIFAQG